MNLLYATQNQAKLTEARDILASLNIQILSPADFPETINFDVAETGKNFAENALLKAQAFAQKTHTLTIAEDFGLEVEALAGKPGVQSKRWLAGTDKDRNQALLQQLRHQSNRHAQYSLVVCLYNPINQEKHFFEAAIPGMIALAIQGDAGFGYDSIFIPEGYQQTFAELGTKIKNSISHRAQALKKLGFYLKNHQ